MNTRFFNLDNQWNAVHLPERPNGFGLLVLGDKEHFVEGSTSSWIQHLGRWELIQHLLEKGYTVFYSNLFGCHWGSPKSFRMAKQLYHLIMKQEILNKHIHILAEGMGALIALQLMEKSGNAIRSVALLNPCLDFHGYVDQEKHHKFFYRRLVKEVCQAYDVTKEQVEEVIGKYPKLEEHQSTIPVKIWATTSGKSPYPLLHCKAYEEHRKKLNAPVQLSLYLNEKKYLIRNSLVEFFEENEKVL